MGEIYQIKIDELHPHLDNPFGIRDDPSMMELVESVKQFGILVPSIARPREDGGYQTNYFYAAVQRQDRLDKEVYHIVRRKAVPGRKESGKGRNRKGQGNR